MSFLTVESPQLILLPPIISNNPRELVDPEYISVSTILHPHKGRRKSEVRKSLVEIIPSPKPLHPIEIQWAPESLIFHLKEEPVINKLCIRNSCNRILYVHCCGLWGPEARLGAYWTCFPKTRFLIAPGLCANMYISASPKEQSPVSFADVNVQVAASQKRDVCVAHYVVPLRIEFQNYIPPSICEDE